MSPVLSFDGKTFVLLLISLSLVVAPVTVLSDLGSRELTYSAERITPEDCCNVFYTPGVTTGTSSMPENVSILYNRAVERGNYTTSNVSESTVELARRYDYVGGGGAYTRFTVEPHENGYLIEISPAPAREVVAYAAVPYEYARADARQVIRDGSGTFTHPVEAEIIRYKGQYYRIAQTGTDGENELLVVTRQLMGIIGLALGLIVLFRNTKWDREREG